MSRSLHLVADAPGPTGRIVFQDGLGTRVQVRHPVTNETLEVLRFHPALTAVPSFEFAVRERITRLTGFHEACFSHVRGAGRRSSDGGPLLLVSHAVPGVRLAERLAGRRRDATREFETSLHWIRQIASAVARLHEHDPEVAHGAIGPERIVVTPDDRLVVVEHVLGAALEQLRCPADRYWRDFGVAWPPWAGTASPGQRADVMQVGLVALCLLLGRPLRTAEFPAQIAGLLAAAFAASGDGDTRPWPIPLRSWLERALQLDGHRSFASGLQASADLETLVARGDLDSDPAPVPTRAHDDVGAGLVPAPGPVPAQSLVSGRATTTVAPTLSVPAPVPAATITIRATIRLGRGAATLASVLVLLLAVTGIGVLAWQWSRGSNPVANTGSTKPESPGTTRVVAAPPKPASQWGQLEVRTDPPGAQVMLDDVPLGVSPMRIDVASGDYAVRLQGRGEAVNQRVTIRPATTTSLVVPLTPPARGFGWISITAPVDVQAYERGQLLGSSQSRRIMVPAGRHDLQIVNDVLGYRAARTVQVGPGAVVDVKVEFPAGMLTLTTTPSSEVWIDGTRAGETPLHDLAVPLGPHEIVFRHPQLGERRHAVTVTIAGPVRLNVDLTRR